MFRRLFRDRAFIAALAAFLLIGGHLISRAAGSAQDRHAAMLDVSPECHTAASSPVNDRRLLPRAPDEFLLSVDLAKTRAIGPALPGSPVPVAVEEFEAALAGGNGQSPAVRLESINRYIAGLQRAQGLMPAFEASERSQSVVAELSAAAPAQAFTLHARRGALRERAGAGDAALDAYGEALLIDLQGAATDERVLVRWRRAALLQGHEKASAIDTLAEAAGLMRAQVTLPNCRTERRASLVWELARLYESLGLEREAGALRDGLARRRGDAN